MTHPEKNPLPFPGPENLGPYSDPGAEPIPDHMPNRLLGEALTENDGPANQEFLIPQASLDLSLEFLLDSEELEAVYIDDDAEFKIITPKLRVIMWELNGNEKDMARIAGWEKFPYHKEEKMLGPEATPNQRRGFLEIPESTRSAYSVFSGTEAWRGEKANIVEWVTGYMKSVYESDPVYATFDKDFSWNQVGITPTGEIFVAPPNSIDIAETYHDIKTWKERVLDDLASLLERDEHNIKLVDKFQKDLDEIFSHVA